MAKTSYASVDDYIAARADESREILERVRDAIRKAIPDAEETITYQMPTYKVSGVATIYFAGWKEHFSIYPATQTLLDDLGDELARYKIVKGTIRFPLSDPPPAKLIGRIAKQRANEVTRKLKTKTGSATRRATKAAAKRGTR